MLMDWKPRGKERKKERKVENFRQKLDLKGTRRKQERDGQAR